MYIQSFSDIITNSSSEVFICRPKEESKAVELAEEIQKFIDTLMEVLGYANDDYYTGATVMVSPNGGYDDDYRFSWDKGDILIESFDDNSIPYHIMEILGDLDCVPKFSDKITSIYRHHLG